MKYRVQIEGFERENVELELRGFFTRARLLVNGVPAPKNRAQFQLMADDGREAQIKLRSSFLFDPTGLSVDGKYIRVRKPLAWYQYLLCGVPLIWLIGALVGGVIGAVLVAANVRIFRSKLPPLAQYGLVLLLSVGLPVVCVAFLVEVYSGPSRTETPAPLPVTQVVDGVTRTRQLERSYSYWSRSQEGSLL